MSDIVEINISIGTSAIERLLQRLLQQKKKQNERPFRCPCWDENAWARADSDASDILAAMQSELDQLNDDDSLDIAQKARLRADLFFSTARSKTNPGEIRH